MLDACNRVSKLYVEMESFHILELYVCTRFSIILWFLIDNEYGMLNLHPYFPWGAEQLLKLLLKVGDM
jgi:hypothetical protein